MTLCPGYYLDNTLMVAPEDGYVINLQVRPGMVAGDSSQSTLEERQQATEKMEQQVAQKGGNPLLGSDSFAPLS